MFVNYWGGLDKRSLLVRVCSGTDKQKPFVHGTPMIHKHKFFALKCI